QTFVGRADFNGVTLADIRRAQQRIFPFVRRTPLVRNSTLSHRFGSNLYLKLEVSQRTGAFKVRGAFNKILCLSQEERHRGVVAVSGGNHAQAVAYAAGTLGTKALVLMPEITPRHYVDATREYGAEVVLTRRMAEAFDKVHAYEEKGWVFVHPFED